MREMVKFGTTITFEDLNPHNFHLKNDYINNLLFMAIHLLQNTLAEGISPTVVRCFISNGYMEQNLPELKKRKYSQKYTQGLGICITWEDYEALTALSIIPKIVHAIPSNIYSIINHDAKQVELFFEMSETSKVFEIVNGEERQVA